MAEKELTQNMVRFCEEWLIHGNGTLAYKTAYPNVKKDSSAGVNASKLLKTAKIKSYLDARKAEIAAKLEITPEKTLRAYAERAYFDPRQLVDPETGRLIPLHRLPEHVAACVTKIKARQLKPVTRENEETGEPEFLEQSIIEVEWDKGDSSRDALAKFQGLFEADNVQRRLSAIDEILRLLPDAVKEDLKAKAKKMVEEDEG